MDQSQPRPAQAAVEAVEASVQALLRLVALPLTLRETAKSILRFQEQLVRAKREEAQINQQNQRLKPSCRLLNKTRRHPGKDQ